eukprot:COSAG02_NODE_5757_length_4062_cov_12.533687_2_plen_387_part_00
MAAGASCGALLLVASAAAAAATPCATCRGPAFSWDTVPKFIHTSNASGPVNADALALLAKFPMVTIEKFQGPCGNDPHATPACDQEARIIETLKGVKAINPEVSAIFYYNTVLDFAQYKLHGLMEAEPSLMMHDSTGKVIKMGGGHKDSDVFDFTNPRARALFIEECINATKSGVVDGCFCDRAVDSGPDQGIKGGDDRVPCGIPGPQGVPCHYNITGAKAAAYKAGRVKVLTDLQTALGAGPLIANHAFGPPHDLMVPGSVSFAMNEFFLANNESIQTILLAVANGRGIQAHVEKPNESILAAFLIGAGIRSYFGVGGWSESRPNFEDHWMPQFDLPLGPPHADATYDAATATWTRAFGKGVKVTFECSTNNGTITGPGWTGAFD